MKCLACALAALSVPAAHMLMFWPGWPPPPCEFIERWPVVTAPEGGLWAQARQEACGDGGFVTIVYTVVTLGGDDGAQPEDVLWVAETDTLDQPVSLAWTGAGTLSVRLEAGRGLTLHELRRQGVAVELLVPPARRARPSR
jgi:hypothetical protein